VGARPARVRAVRSRGVPHPGGDETGYDDETGCYDETGYDDETGCYDETGYDCVVLVRRLLLVALVSDVVGIAVGSAAATGRWPPSRRWSHQGAYAGASACTLAAAASSRCWRDAVAVAPAVAALAAMPRTRPGSPTHIAVAGLATSCLAGGWLALRTVANGSQPSAGPSRGG
jgi:hypothetical protein